MHSEAASDDAIIALVTRSARDSISFASANLRDVKEALRIPNADGSVAEYRMGLTEAERAFLRIRLEYEGPHPGALKGEKLLELFIQAQPEALRGTYERIRDSNDLTQDSQGPEALLKFIVCLRELASLRDVVLTDNKRDGEEADARYAGWLRFPMLFTLLQTASKPREPEAAAVTGTADIPQVD